MIPTRNLYPHPLIAREGWPFIFLAFVVALLASHWWGLWSSPIWIIFIFVVQFFRDPPRILPNVDNAVLAPADGRIVVVQKVKLPTLAPHLDTDQPSVEMEEQLKISIFMNVFNVHSNRAPMAGVVEQIDYHPGQFVNASADKASEANERNSVVLRLSNNQRIRFVQVAGLIARRILCYVQVGDHLRAGQRYGFIRFGSRVDVYLPLSAQPLVVVGQKVSATSTVIAILPSPV